MRVSVATALATIIIGWNYKTERLIRANEELKKPFSFWIDGPDPFLMTE